MNRFVGFLATGAAFDCSSALLLLIVAANVTTVGWDDTDVMIGASTGVLVEVEIPVLAVETAGLVRVRGNGTKFCDA